MVKNRLLLLFFIFSSTFFLNGADEAFEKKAEKPYLKLEAGIKGDHSIYPGQKTWLYYRYYFQGNISLTVEILPLLDAAGLIKIGEKEFKDYTEGTISVSEISQQVEAVKPGSFSFGPSRIEGYASQGDRPGNPIQDSDLLVSEAPPVILTVLPFPEKDQPASFNGAVGIFTFKASLKSPVKMEIGDDITLLLEISGKGNLKNVIAPDLCCQPGFSGFFSFSDLPPSEEIEGDVKKILIKIRPLNALLKAIPGIEFSYFNPETVLYAALHSEPISIAIGDPMFENIGSQLIDKSPKEAESQDSEFDKKKQTSSPAIELESLFSLDKEDLHNKLFGSWWSLVIVPIGLFLLFYQKLFRDSVIWQRMNHQPATARQLFREAFPKNGKVGCNFSLLKKAMKLALVEAGLLATADIPDEQLPDEGLVLEVKKFLALLDEKQFSGKEACDLAEIRLLSESIINKICNSSDTPPSSGLRTII